MLIMGESYALNPSKLAKGLPEIVFGCFIAEPANEQRPQGIAFDVWVIAGFDCNSIRISLSSVLRSGNSEMRRHTFIATVGAQMLQLFFLLELHSVALLEPALRRRVFQMLV